MRNIESFSGCWVKKDNNQNGGLRASFLFFAINTTPIMKGVKNMNNDQKVFLGGLIMGGATILSVVNLKNAVKNIFNGFKSLK